MYFYAIQLIHYIVNHVSFQEDMLLMLQIFQYLQTLKTLANQLGLSDIPGVNSIAHLPEDQRSAMGAKRLEALQMLSTRVEAFKGINRVLSELP